MKFAFTPVAIAAVLLYPVSSSADVFTLDFEGIGNKVSIGLFYALNYGVSFSTGAYSLVDQDAGGTGNFENEPSPSAVFLNEGPLVIVGNGIYYRVLVDVPAGFNTGLAFRYSASQPGTIVRAFDGVAGSGDLLGSTQLGFGVFGCQNNLCNWRPAGFSFSGVAKSVEILAYPDSFILDDLTFGASVPPAPVPEPSQYALLLTGLLGLVALRKLGRYSGNECNAA